MLAIFRDIYGNFLLPFIVLAFFGGLLFSVLALFGYGEWLLYAISRLDLLRHKCPSLRTLHASVSTLNSIQVIYFAGSLVNSAHLAQFGRVAPTPPPLDR